MYYMHISMPACFFFIVQPMAHSGAPRRTADFRDCLEISLGEWFRLPACLFIHAWVITGYMEKETVMNMSGWTPDQLEAEPRPKETQCIYIYTMFFQRDMLSVCVSFRHTHTYIYIYKYIEKEREREREWKQFLHISEELEQARTVLNDATFDAVGNMRGMEPTTFLEILSTAKEGEVRYIWQMCVCEESGTWINLPFCLSRILDREYAKFCSILPAHRRKVLSFVIQVNLGIEMKYSWVLEQSNLNQDRLRVLQLPCGNLYIYIYIHTNHYIYIYIHV